MSSTAANAGDVERMADIALHPSDPKVMVVRYLNGGSGLLYTSDGGSTFRLLCGDAIGPGRQSGATAITTEGRVLIGTFGGMWRDSGNGCGWSSVLALEGRFMTDLVLDPTDPARVFGVSGNGGAGMKNGLVRSEGADQWLDLGPREEVGLSRVRAVKTDTGMRIYQSALRIDTPSDDAGVPQTQYLLRVSDDVGATWQEHEVSVNSGAFRLEAVDPNNPDRILANVARTNAPDDLLISRDRGVTFTNYLQLSDLGAITFAPDGRLWIGEPSSAMSATASRGLWYAPNLDTTPTKVSEIGVECLAYQPANRTLYACQAYAFGRVDTVSWSYTELFHFRSATEFVACDGVDMASVCQAQLCADYCGAAHFAQARLCCNYSTSSCGPLVAQMEGTGGPEMCDSPAADGGMAGSPPAAGTGGALVMRDAGSSPAGTSRDGGCSCRALQSTGRDATGVLLSLVTAAGLVLRSRRRRIEDR